MGKRHTWSEEKYREGTHTDTWSEGTHGGRAHMEWGPIWRGDICGDEIHKERGHTRRGDIYRHIE